MTKHREHHGTVKTSSQKEECIAPMGDDEAFFEMLSKIVTVRTYHALRRSDRVHDAQSFLDFSEEEFAALQNVGKRSVRDFRAAKRKIRKFEAQTDAPFPTDETTPGDTVELTDAEEIGNVVERSGFSFATVDQLYTFLADFISVRTQNALRRSGRADTLSSFLALPDMEFASFRSVGKKSVTEFHEAKANILAMLQEQRAIGRASSDQEDDVERDNAKQERERDKAKERILKLADQFFPVSLDALQESVSREFPMICEQESSVQKLVSDLVQADLLVQEGEGYRTYRDSAAEIIGASEKFSEREKGVFSLRSNGATLEETGSSFGISRERVRQIEKKIFRRIHKARETRFAKLFRTYCFENETLTDVFGFDEVGIYYLSGSSSKGKQDPLEALGDESIPIHVRKALKRNLHRNDLLVDGTYIPCQSNEVLRYFLSHYCEEEISVDDFVAKYAFFLSLLGHEEDSSLVLEGRYAETKLSKSPLVLWKQGRRFRYYDVQRIDIEELLQELHFDEYQDVAVSAQIFLDRYPEEAERYDLRDAYELHNLLKKCMTEELLKRYNLSLGRMPNLVFGTATEYDQAVELIEQEGAIPKDELAELYRREYGVLQYTFRVNTEIKLYPYLHHGSYTLDIVKLTKSELERLRRLLTREFFFLDEVRDIMRSAFPKKKGALNRYNLWQVGFDLTARAVYRNTYSNALSALEGQIGTTGFLQVTERFSDYRAVLYHDIANLDVIEFSAGKFIHIRRLEQFGVGKPELLAVSEEVLREAGESYFTVASLRRSGRSFSLDRLGFDDMFIESILRYGGTFQSQRIGCTYLFHHGGSAKLVGLLEDILEREESIDIDELRERLDEEYGIRLHDNHLLRDAADDEGTDLFYQDIMHKMYRDYDTYYQEV